MLNWLKQFLYFSIPRQTSPAPDGRPLYAYKMSERSYAELKELMRQQLKKESRVGVTVGFDRLFCLYAAETFRREHIEGAWSYKTVFEPLGLEPPVVTKIHDWIETGLTWWKRRLLHSEKGHRQFLVTIVVEGGLPLRLLERESINLTRYFRNILESLYQNDQRDIDHAIHFANNHATRLPRSLQHDQVFHLAAHLITKIVELQSLVGKAVNPISVLDKKLPRWRHDLPLRVENQVAEALLTGLVRHSQKLANEAAAQLRWRGCLNRSGKHWLIEKRLELPASLTMKQIANCIGIQDANRSRWRVLLQGPNLIEPVARLTLIQGADESARYRREWLKQQGFSLKDDAVQQFYQLILHDGKQEYPVAVKHADAWSHSPWIFVEQPCSGELEWIAEGSVRTKADQVWVVAKANMTPRVVSGSCERVAEIIDRYVYLVTGHVELITQDEERYSIFCRTTEDSEDAFSISGHIVSEALQQRPVYRGLPNLYTANQDGCKRTAFYKTQWRFVGDRSLWKSTCWNAYGRIWLRLVDDHGVERCRKQVDVVPQDFKIDFEIGTASTPGSLHLTGIAGAKIVLKNKDLNINILHSEDQYAQIECAALSNTLPTLDLMLCWPESEPVALSVLYPQRGASFRLAGQSLSDNDLAPVDRLGGMQLLIQDPTSQRFRLEAELITISTSDRSSTQQSWSALDNLRMLFDQQKYSFQEALPFLINKRLDISLFRWQERIESLLASTDDLEDQVRLSILTKEGERLASVLISRFDVILQPNKSQNRVYIPESSLLHLGSDWESRVKLNMIRLWEPRLPAIALQPDSHQSSCWLIPPDLEPGPWWILGYDHDWARFRPLLWSVISNTEHSQSIETESSLSAVICEANLEKRRHELDRILIELGDNLNDPDWALLFSYLRLTRDIPPSALDVVRQLINHPRTLAQALLRADDNMFETVWSLSSCMPFLWELIAIDDWLYAANIYFGGLVEALAHVESGEEIVFNQFKDFRDRMSMRRPGYWNSLSDWLQERLFKNRKLTGSELHLTRQVLDQFIDQRRDEMLARHDADETWPQSHQVKMRMNAISDWTEKHAVLYAPVVAADVSRHGGFVTPQLTHQLRLLRLFDQEWFDVAYAVALTMNLAEMTPES